MKHLKIDYILSEERKPPWPELLLHLLQRPRRLLLLHNTLISLCFSFGQGLYVINKWVSSFCWHSVSLWGILREQCSCCHIICRCQGGGEIYAISTPILLISFVFKKLIRAYLYLFFCNVSIGSQRVGKVVWKYERSCAYHY